MNQPAIDQNLKMVADWISRSKAVTVLTGAGISVESGIPDFRSKGGLWDRFDPYDYGHIDSFIKNPARVWDMFIEMDELVTDAKPNPGHYALARLERAGHVIGVITQNVDNLHQTAGSENVIEFHGNHTRLSCYSCGRKYHNDIIDKNNLPPWCNCGAPLKPDVILFGEMIPDDAYRKTISLVEQTDLMLVVGTSATVPPAAMIPGMAKQSGAKIVIVNIEYTDLIENLTDTTIIGEAGKVLPQLVELINFND